MKDLRRWQFFRTFYMKGCLFRIRMNLVNFRSAEFITVDEKIRLASIIRKVNELTENFDENSRKLRPEEKPNE